jgi:HAD superfamily hydrolase (TIGR01509 family)
MLSTILWDHDGVLVNTEPLYFRATADVLKQAGVTLTLAQYQQFHLVESRGSWHLAGPIDAAEIARLRAERNARYTELVTRGDVVIPGAIDLLRRLKAHYRMAVVTSSLRGPFEAIHRASGLHDHIEFALTREDYRESKPDPEPYLTAVARLGVAKATCVVVEDTERGLMAARAAGLRCWIIQSEMAAGLCFDGAERQFPSLAAVGEALVAEAGVGAKVPKA